MLTLGIVCKKSLLSLTRICLNSQFSILNSQFSCSLALIWPARRPVEKAI